MEDDLHDDKLLEKTTWYKGDKKRKLDNKTSKYKYIPPTKKRRKGQAPRQQGGKGEKKKVKAVMFIPYTTHSELATRLRENEDKMQEMTGYSLKIVEKGGTKLVDILHKANP